MLEYFATLGPSCQNQETLEAMIKEGITGVRLNLSHTSLQESQKRLENLNAACTALGRRVDLMVDVHGPEQRTGWPKEPIHLFKGDKLILRSRRRAEELPVVSVSPLVLNALEPEDHILIHDGFAEIKVLEELEEADPPELPPQEEGAEVEVPDIEKMRADGYFKRFLCETIRGDIVRGQQSVKVVGKEIYGDILTATDLANLDQAKEAGVTALMQPFVRGAADIECVRAALRERDLDLRIFAKIESRTGLDNLEEIIEAADHVVIARGDLGNAMPLWELPRVQKEIAAKCRAAGKPFMVVTQMLASMARKATPTRAEVSDIFNAVMDGAASVMVTGETSVGDHPVEVVRYLVKTAQEAEAYKASLGL